MARDRLEELIGERMTFEAKVERFGKKSGWQGREETTILLVDVLRTDTAEIVTNHLWFTAGSSWYLVEEGDRVRFDARVSGYEKGYFGRREEVYRPCSVDYRLERPTKIRKL